MLNGYRARLELGRASGPVRRAEGIAALIELGLAHDAVYDRHGDHAEVLLLSRRQLELVGEALAVPRRRARGRLCLEANQRPALQLGVSVVEAQLAGAVPFNGNWRLLLALAAALLDYVGEIGGELPRQRDRGLLEPVVGDVDVLVHAAPHET